MKKKNEFDKAVWIVGFLILIIIILGISTSCKFSTQKPSEPGYEINISEGNVVIILNESNNTNTGLVIVLDTGNNKTNNTITLSNPETEEQPEESKTRASEVDFYFLLKGKSYFRHTLKENQIKTYNMSGILVTIEPIIITPNSVKFRINNYTTKALQEDDSDSTQEFEIIVSDIYYRS